MSDGMRLLGLIGSTLALCYTSMTHGDEQSPRTEFVLGNVEFVLLHELAHVVIGDKRVPILGSLESAADYTAIVMAIRGNGNEEAAEFLGRALSDTATAFAASWRLAASNDADIPYWDNHGLGIQRYYAMICLIYGSAPELHGSLADKLPPGRRAGCAAEYRLADEGVQWLVDTYGSEPDPGERAAIVFDYGPVATANQQRVRDAMQERSMVENTVRAVDAAFHLQRPLKVSMRTCGRPEAAWQPEQRELLICYELLDAFARIHAYDNRRERRSR